MPLGKSSSSNNTINNKLFGYSVQTSLVGRVIPKVQGTVKMGGNVIWNGNWNAILQNGKGIKANNKGGSNNYDYQCAFLIGLCGGQINGVYNIWANKDQYNLQFASPTFTVPSGGGTYTTPQAGAVWFLNVSVTRADSYTYTANDYGSPGSTTGSGTQQTPIQLVPLGSSLAAGQYSLNVQSSGVGYNFSSADAGRVMTIIYAYDIPNSTSTNNTTSTGPARDPLTHLNLSLFTGAQGQAPWNWMLQYFPAQALGYSGLAYIGSALFDLGSAGVIPNLNFEVSGGPIYGGAAPFDCNPADMIRDILTNPLDGVPGWVTSSGSSSGFGLVSLNGIVTIDSTGLNVTGTSGSAFTTLVSGQSITIGGQLGVVATVIDSTHLTLQAPGVSPGVSAWTGASFQSYSQITGQSSYLPTTGQNVAIDSTGEVFQYCAANGIFLSLNMESQQDARSWLNDILLAANADAFWSEGVLKFRSYGDTTAVGNGCTFTPSTAPIYDIDDSDLICKPGEEPIKVSRPDARDVKNRVAIEWTNRDMGYSQNSLPEEDFCNVQQYGAHPEATKSLKSICQQSIAQLVGTNIVRRSVYIDGDVSIEIELPIHFLLLEPMDNLTLNDPYRGFGPDGNYYAFRIVDIEETDHLTLKFRLEVFPWSVSAPTLYPKQQHLATYSGFFASPGYVNTPMFIQLPEEIAQGNEYTIGIALSGQQNWGGAQVFVSTNGEDGDYEPAGTCVGPAIMGVLTAALPVSADPDTTDTLSVDLSESLGEDPWSPTYTKAQADALVPLVAVDGEVMAFENVALAGGGVYNITYLRRGAYGTGISAHAVGAQFCVISSLFEYQYNHSAIGKTLWFKFCSVNLAGGRPNDISQVQAYPYFVTGPRLPYIWSPAWQLPMAGEGLATTDQFGVQPGYTISQSGSPINSITVKGILPPNLTSPILAAPAVSAVASNTGGSLAPGTYIIGACSEDATGTKFGTTQPSPLLSVVVGGSGSGSIALTVAYPSSPTTYGVDIYVAFETVENGFTYTGHIIPPSTTATITSFSYGGAGMQDSTVAKYAIEKRVGYHTGILGAQVQAVTTTTVTITAPTGNGHFAANALVGRYISCLAKLDPTVDIPYFNYYISANTGSGDDTTITVGTPPGGSTLPLDLTTLLVIGDVIDVSMQPTSSTPNSVTDTMLNNPFAPTGLDGAVEPGRTLWALFGTDSGDRQPILSISGGDTIEISGAFATTPDATTVFVIADSTPSVGFTDEVSILNKVSSPFSITAPTVQNISSTLTNPTFIIRVFPAAEDGTYDDNPQVRVRKVYMFGSQGTDVISGSTGSQSIRHGLVRHNAPSGGQAFSLLHDTAAPNAQLMGINIGTGPVTYSAASGNTFLSGSTTLTLAPGQFTKLRFPGDGSGVIIPTAGVGSGGAGGNLSVDTTISAAVTFSAGTSPIPAVSQGLLLSCRFEQDSTGHSVTWGSGFKSMPTIDQTPLTVSAGLCVGGADGNWWPVGPWLIGVHS